MNAVSRSRAPSSLRPALPSGLPHLLATGLALAFCSLTLSAAHAVALRAPDAKPADFPIEPQVLQQSTEDDQVRIDETRVGGATRKLTVQPKIKGMPAYEIATPTPGRPTAQDPKAGQRVWLNIGF